MMHEGEKSDSAIVAEKPTNKAGKSAAEPVEPRAGTKGKANQQSTRRAQDRESVSQALGRIRQAAKDRKKEKFTSLLHHIDPPMLRTAFYALSRNAAPGVDGMTWETYEKDLDRRIEELHGRVQSGAYRALPSRRGSSRSRTARQRPLAVAALEDKIVQRAATMVLNAIYEEDFLGFSYGFRPEAKPACCAGRADRRDRQQEGELDTGRRHPVVLQRSQPGMAGPLRRASDRRQAHRPPDPEMAEGGNPGRRDRRRGGKGDRAGRRNIAAARQRLPALRVRSLGAPLATAGGERRRDPRAIRGRHRRRLSIRERRQGVLGRDA